MSVVNRILRAEDNTHAHTVRRDLRLLVRNIGMRGDKLDGQKQAHKKQGHDGFTARRQKGYTRT